MALRTILIGLMLLALPGCSLLTKADALEFRYFTAAPPPGPASKAKGAMELRTVLAASHVTTRMLYRVSAREFGHYETRRWTDEPAQYLRRGLERAFFEDGELKRALSGSHPSLEVELTAFEASWNEDQEDAVAQVALRAFLYGERMSLSFQTIEASLPVAQPGDPESVAEAMALALQQAIATLVKEVDQKLATGN